MADHSKRVRRPKGNFNDVLEYPEGIRFHTHTSFDYYSGSCGCKNFLKRNIYNIIKKRERKDFYKTKRRRWNAGPCPFFLCDSMVRHALLLLALSSSSPFFRRVLYRLLGAFSREPKESPSSLNNQIKIGEKRALVSLPYLSVPRHQYDFNSLFIHFVLYVS